MRDRGVVALAFAAVLAAIAPGQVAEAATGFEPVGFKLGDEAVVVTVPEGVRRVRLLALGDDGETWHPVTMAHLDGRGGHLKLRLPAGILLESLRCEASHTDPFPYEFYQGATEFSDVADQPDAGFNRGLVNEVAGDAAADGAAGGAVAVVESNIWKWRGSDLYFFNSLRGLQVFDLSVPGEPAQVASLRMPAVGEQMYLVGDRHVALLANGPGAGWYGGGGSAPGSEVVLVEHSGSDLGVTWRYPVEGAFVESRMVGETLYAVTRVWESYVDADDIWRVRSGLNVYGIDLADPSAPEAVEPLALVSDDGESYWYNAVVSATPDFLFVVPTIYDQATRQSRSVVHGIPLGDGGGAGSLAVAKSAQLRGFLRDKFKLREDGEGILTAVSQVQGRGVTAYTSVETFDLGGEGAASDRAEPLDSVSLAPGETVRATRFDGDRLYVVTFRVIDPLFIVDLTDPRGLDVVAELEIPGWSTYLEPLGDRLLSVGVEDRRVAVSLFDVETPESLAMLARRYLGAEDGWSWSEANYDEKAVGWFAEAGLLVLPFSSYADGVSTSAMQLVDVGGDTLTNRGVLDTGFNARRSHLLEDGSTLVAITGRSLRVIDVADRDAPEVVAELPVAWAAERVVATGDALVQFESGNYSWWVEDGVSRGNPAVVRVSDPADPDRVRATVEVSPGGQVAGVARGDEVAYLLTTRTEASEVPGEKPDETTWEYHTILTTTVIGLRDPDEPVVLGAVESGLEDTWFYGRFRGAFLPGGELVWLPDDPSPGAWWWGCLACDVGVGVAGDIAGDAIGWPFFGYGMEPRVIVVDVNDPAEPEAVAEFSLGPEGEDEGGDRWGYREYGPVFLDGSGRLLFGYRTSRWEDGVFESEHFVDGVDLADPSAPVRREPVNVPGLLKHLVTTPEGGDILITLRPGAEVDNEGRSVWNGTGVVEASAFDGLTAFLVDTVELEGGAYSPVVGSGRSLFAPSASGLGAGDGDVVAGVDVVRWDDGAAGFAPVEQLPLAASPHTLVTRDGYVFAFRWGGVDVIGPGGVPGGFGVVSHESAALTYYGYNAFPAISPDGATAFLPVGDYGVEAVAIGPLPGIGVEPAGVRAGAGEGEGDGGDGPGEWEEVPIEPAALTAAATADFVGSLGIRVLAWRFEPGAEPLGYAEWAALHFNPAGDPGWTPPPPGGDSDGDGSADGIEFLLGTGPLDPASVAAPAVAALPGGEAGFEVRFLWDPAAAAEGFTVELSGDLVDWRTGVPGVDFTVTTGGAGVVVVVPGPVAPSPEDRSFARVRPAIEGF